jgi:ATP-dependent exoDNAse (exonuclease V) beta subunit
MLVKDKVDFIQDIYKDVEQKSLDKNEGGWVTVEIQNDKTKEEDYSEYCLEKTLQHIQSNRELGYSWKDIAILCRNNKDLRYLAEEISQLEIPVISAEALYVTNSPEVRMLLTYLKLACNSNDSHEQIRLILQLKKIHQLDFDFYPIGKAILSNSGSDNFLLLCKSLGFQLSIGAGENCDMYERIERGIEELGIGIQANSYLLAFMNAAHEYCRKNAPVLSQFIQFFESNSDDFKLDMPENMDAVKLLTIHKSKGLEFPVVIFPFADNVLRFDNHLWVNLEGEIEGLKAWLVQPSQELKSTSCGPQLEWEENMALLDALNLFYVACTRAIAHLHIICSTSSRRKFNHHLLPVWNSLNDDLKEGGCAEWGEAARKVESNLDSDNGIELRSMYSYPERNKLDYAPLQHVDLNDPSHPVVAGELVHNLLAEVKKVEDLDQVLNKARVRYPGFEDFFEKLKSQIENTLFGAELRYLFEQDRVLNERDFADKHGNIHRPDRVVVMENEVVVLDYKTGEEALQHHEQVLQYKLLVSEVFDKPAKGYLAYLDLNKIIEV